MAKKALVDTRYILCQGCDTYWKLKTDTDMACEKCMLEFAIYDARDMINMALARLKLADFGIKDRPMIERE